MGGLRREGSYGGREEGRIEAGKEKMKRGQGSACEGSENDGGMNGRMAHSGRRGKGGARDMREGRKGSDEREGGEGVRTAER